MLRMLHSEKVLHEHKPKLQADAPCRFEQMLDPVMLEVKKLRTLQRKGNEMEKNKVVEKTRKYLVSLPLFVCVLPVSEVKLQTGGNMECSMCFTVYASISALGMHTAHVNCHDTLTAMTHRTVVVCLCNPLWSKRCC